MTITYKYKSAHEWLKESLQREDDLGKLRAMAFTFAREMDGDAIQELFEKEMDADGFFEEISS